MKKLIVICVAVGGIASAAFADESQLYESFETLGALDCEIAGDIRLIAGTDRFLRCDYTPRDVPDGLKRYAGYVREVQEGRGTTSDDFACWTVLHLKSEESAEPARGAVKGVYSSATAAAIEQYGLKDGALVGGRKQQFALEPRCVAPRSGDNVAHVILRFEIGD